jgi:hypothetical protein
VGHYGLSLPDQGAHYSPTQHGENFQRFLRFVARNSAGFTQAKPNNHWRPQSDILDEARKVTAIDYIGRTETLAADMEQVWKRAGCEHGAPDLGRFNQSYPAPYRLEEILTPRIERLLVDIYGRDYAEFGYLLLH